MLALDDVALARLCIAATPVRPWPSAGAKLHTAPKLTGRLINKLKQRFLKLSSPQGPIRNKP